MLGENGGEKYLSNYQKGQIQNSIAKRKGLCCLASVLVFLSLMNVHLNSVSLRFFFLMWTVFKIYRICYNIFFGVFVCCFGFLAKGHMQS